MSKVNTKIPTKTLLVFIFIITIVLSYFMFSTKSGWVRVEEGSIFTVQTEVGSKNYEGVESLTVSIVSLNIVQFVLTRFADPDYTSKLLPAYRGDVGAMEDSARNSFEAVSEFLENPNNSSFINPNITLDEVTLQQIPAKGSSAGLAYALSLINTLNYSKVDNTILVAATGSIKPDGRVVAVAGVDLKIKLAEKNGVDLVFIPEKSPIDKNDYSLKIVETSSLQEAVDILCAEKYYKQCY